MDTTKTPAKSPADVEAVIGIIKAHMPETYSSIQAHAQTLGKGAYALVRSGIKGQPNCFYAFERGHVVGTPFTLTEIARDVAQLMVTLGVQSVVVWPEHAVQQQVREQANAASGAA